MRTIHGPAVANKATAHKMARIIYYMLRFQQEYDETVHEFYERRREVQIIANLKKKAKQYGKKAKQYGMEAKQYGMEVIPSQA